MLSLAAPLTLLTAYAACLVFTLAPRRRPLGLAAPIAGALLVCFEALLVHALSAFKAVAWPGLLAGNVAIVLMGLATLRRRPSLARCLRWSAREPDPLRMSVAALGVLVLLAAIAYRPNTWDSMTYHLARVAYWVEYRSVAAYPTNISRQIVMPPGAEYLLLVLQAISGSDRFANLVQYGAWVLVAGSASTLARTFGASRSVARWALLLVAASPMALQQASSTQNDLVASVMTIAMVAACLPFLHRGRVRWRWPDVVLMLAALTGGLLVKPTSVVVASPFLLAVLWMTTIESLRQPAAAFAQASRALPALVLAAGVFGPFAYVRMTAVDPAAVTEPFVYPPWGEFGDRMLNSARGVLRDIPVPFAVLDRLASAQTIGCSKAGSLCLDHNLLLNEDVTGSLGAALALCSAVVLGGLRWRRLSARGRLGLVAMAASWIMFHAVFRDNVWIPRLQLPLFALLPVVLGVLDPKWFTRGLGAMVLWFLVVGVGAHGAMAAALSARRPLEPSRVLRGRSAESYYTLGPDGIAREHEAALRALERSSCRRLGMFIGEDSYDYPLAWRAMSEGIEVRHVVGHDGWPCAVFSDRGSPPLQRAGAGWVISDAPSLYFARGDQAATGQETDPGVGTARASSQ